MAIKRLILSLGAPMLALSCSAALILPGCGSRDQGSSNSQKMSKDLAQVQTEIEDLRHQIDLTTASLNQMLATRTGSDLKQDYKQFVEASDHVGTRSDKLIKHGEQMRARREAYLDEWNRNIQSVGDPEVKRTQQERLKDVEERFDQVTQEIDSLKGDLAALRGKLSDLRIAFQYDLTSNGVKAMSDHIQATQDNAATVQEKLGDVSDKLAMWASAMRPTA